MLPAALYTRHAYEQLQAVTMRFENVPASVERLYLWADFFGSRQFVAAVPRNAEGAFVYETRLRPGQEIRFQIYGALPLGAPLLEPTDPAARAVAARVVGGGELIFRVR